MIYDSGIYVQTQQWPRELTSAELLTCIKKENVVARANTSQGDAKVARAVHWEK